MKYKHIIIIILICLFPVITYAGQYKVLRVVDGDTIDIDYNGKKERIRLLCVNTPESVHPDKKQNIPMGKVASDYAKKRLSDQYVDLEFEGRKRGNYGRLLAYVILDGNNFNLELVKQGLSPYYTKYGLSEKYDIEFRAAERYARDQGLHIWGDPALTQKYMRLKSKWGQRQSQSESTSSSKSWLSKINKDWNYVASKRSKVFHRLDCKMAQRICPMNLTGYKTRADAVKDGKRPCKICKP